VYASFLGLEVHIQLLTKTKVFCGCRASFGDLPNTNICPVCMGYPGVLPALNAEAIRMAYVVARSLHCTLNLNALFERKNYFYPDMTKNYQISQYRSPLGKDGFVEIEIRKRKKRIRIREVHLEEDAGKMIHAGDITLLDYNRAGTPLLEIVTEPDMEVGEEAEVLLQGLRRTVRWLGVCDGNMEEGSLRCDANVSVNLTGLGLGSKVEVKNLNSFKFVRKAITHEIGRQTEILERGGTVRQETRLWNENRDVTEAMRSKENAFDYRYFPEPDLPPFVPDKEFLAGVESSLVELPAARRERFLAQYRVSEAQADFLCDEKDTADYFERTVREGADPQSAALWLGSDVKKLLNRTGLALSGCPLTPSRLSQLLVLLGEKRIHGKIAKSVLEAVFAEDKDPLEIIQEKGWEQITDRAQLSGWVDQVIAANPQAVQAIRGGDPKPAGFLVGEVMRRTDGRAEPGAVQDLVKERLSLAAIQLLSFGGAITSVEDSQGDIAPGGVPDVLRLLSRAGKLPERLSFEQVEIRRLLSEEITPEDWAHLIHALYRRIAQGGVSGFVVTHGTDTLPYTASLLHWLFGRTPNPIVLTASLLPPAAEGSDAMENLHEAILVASKAGSGVHVVFNGKTLAPWNLKFERVSRDGFRNWNGTSAAPVEPEPSTDLAGLSLADLKDRLEAAIDRTCILKVHPGMRSDRLTGLIASGVRHFILELYDTGTANLRESPYSLRGLLAEGRDKGVGFYCTSQQEGIVDFSRYVTSHELWKEGAVPMGSLTTESAYTRLLVSIATSAGDEEVRERMEKANADTHR
jgi:aspartyl-tRNA(Asn)/glutamyl-tRNA(Gln) amidotransferase subunit B